MPLYSIPMPTRNSSAACRPARPWPNPAPPVSSRRPKTLRASISTTTSRTSSCCDISAMETKPRRPADCDLHYGGAFEMNAKGAAARLRHGDTGDGQNAAGSRLRRGVGSAAGSRAWCKSEQTGVTCFSRRTGRGLLAGAGGEGTRRPTKCPDYVPNITTVILRGKRSIQYAAASRVYRNCSGILDPPLFRGGMTTEGEDADLTASLDDRHMPRHIARHCSVEPGIVHHFDLPAKRTEARPLVEGEC